MPALLLEILGEWPYLFVGGFFGLLANMAHH